MTNRIKKNCGSALILVLWIIAMLSVIVVSFSFDAHLEGKIASFSRKKFKVESLALSGMELAKSYLDRSHSITGNESEEEQKEDAQYLAANNLRLGKSATITYNFTSSDGMDAGQVRVEITPEDALRNINKITYEDWERVFSLINLPEEMWPDLIDSFFDWTDKDDTTRENGAESDYYTDLEKPYTAANAPLNTVRELLLIKGFSEPILSGGVLNPDDNIENHLVISNGIERLFTTYGSGKVNINALKPTENDLAVLLTLPGITEIEARAIIEERESEVAYTGEDEAQMFAFKSVQDARERLSDIIDDPNFFENITTKSEIFRITSVGKIGHVTKRIWAIVFYDGKIWRVLRWREEP